MQSQEKITQEFRQNGQNGSAGNGYVDKVINRLSTKSGEVINISSRTRALAHTRAEAVYQVVNLPGNILIQDLINSCDTCTPGARAIAHTDAHVHAYRGKKYNENYFRKLRIAKFGGDFNPVEEVVKEAIKAFKPARPEIDARVWLKIANAIGYSNFLDCVWQQQALFREWESAGKQYANKAAIFQHLLKKRFPNPKSKGGAK